MILSLIIVSIKYYKNPKLSASNPGILLKKQTQLILCPQYVHNDPPKKTSTKIVWRVNPEIQNGHHPLYSSGRDFSSCWVRSYTTQTVRHTIPQEMLTGWICKKLYSATTKNTVLIGMTFDDFALSTEGTQRSLTLGTSRLQKKLLRQDICKHILFLHAVLGCDTTFRLQGIEKGAFLKKSKESYLFREKRRYFMHIQLLQM